MSVKRILVIDDEAGLVETMKARLETKGYAVATAYNGKEGIDKMKEQLPDLIILDILMPEMDGYTFVQEIKSLPDAKDIPIIIVSAKEEMKELFAAEGIKEYVVKPFDHQDFFAKVEKVLGE